MIMVGVAGAGRHNDAERLKKSFISLVNSKDIQFDKVFVESDARIALEGAFSGRPEVSDCRDRFNYSRKRY